MGFLYLLEDIRVPVLNEFMLAITTLGEETAFLVVALILFWCVNKRLGYYILSVGFLISFSSFYSAFPGPGYWTRTLPYWNRRGKRQADIAFPVGIPKAQPAHLVVLHTLQRTEKFGSPASSLLRSWHFRACTSVCIRRWMWWFPLELPRF